MSKWEASKIYIWFCDKFDTGEENCLPYNPDKFMFHIVGQNEEMDMLTLGSINILKTPKLIEYEPIESFFAHPDIPRYMRSKEGEDWTPKMWENFFVEAMNKKKILEMTVTGLNYVELVSVEDFVYGKIGGREKDTSFTLQIKQYKEAVIEQEDIKIDQEMPPTNTNDDKEVGNQIPAKDTIGASNYLVGPAYKTLLSCQREDSGSRYKWYFANGTKKIEGISNFNYLPVKVESKRSIEKGNPYLSPLGKYLVDYGKNTPQQIWGNLNTYFQFALSSAWSKTELKSYFNKGGGTPTPEELTREGEKLYNYVAEKVNNITHSAIKTTDFDLWYLTIKNGKTKENYLESWLKNYTGSPYTIRILSSKPITIWSLSSMKEFKINDGSNVGDVVQEYPKGTSLYARSDESTIVTDNKNSEGKEISFTVSGINKDTSNYSPYQ